MGNRIKWDIEDEYGDNPTGRSGCFEFYVFCDVYPEYASATYTPDDAGYPEYGTGVEIDSVVCAHVSFDDETAKERDPTPEEAQELCEWFTAYLDSRPAEFKALKERAYEYSYIDKNYADLDY